MFDFDIGGNEIKPEAAEGIANIPFNRTLLAQKLTNQAPVNPEVVHGLKTVEAVFEHFKPEVEVEMESLDGMPVKETMRFKSVADFSGQREMVSQSPFLRSLDAQYQEYTQIGRRLQGHRILQTALGNADTKAALIESLQALVAELEANEKLTLNSSYNLFYPLPSQSFFMESEPTVPQTKADARPSTAVSRSVTIPGLSALSAYGGYAFIESFLDGSQNLNPDRKARKKIYLDDPTKETDRAVLKEKLKLWIDVLSSSDNQNEMLATANKKAVEVEQNLQKNLLTTLETTRELETSYRALSLFYKNTESEKLSNVSILNASFEQLTDLDNSRFIDFVANELKQNYDRLDLRQNYSLLVIPGFMGSNAVLEKWAKIAHANKVTLFTDFADLESSDDVIDMFSTANMTGAELFRSNVIMTCNWVVGRSKVAEVGEVEHLYVPPSAALAGKIYYTLMSQVTAGKKHGGMNEVPGVRFPLRKSELSAVERLNLVPMIDEYGRVMAFGSKTLFNGDNIGLQTYSVVRVFDYIVKVLFDFLNRRAFENWNSLIEADLRRQIAGFLDSIKGPDKLIDQFRIMRLERDDKIKDRIYLDIRLTPYFPAKSFVIRLDGRRGDDVESPEWVSDYGQM